MTIEEKQMLLKDICARVPYGVKVKNTHSDTVYDLKEYMYCLPTALATNFKPYLRPMSSMTDDEYKEFSKISGLLKSKEDNYFSNHLPEWGNSIITERVMVRTIDWLNSHHFDYRGLISMGLAFEAPVDMYKTQ